MDRDVQQLSCSAAPSRPLLAFDGDCGFCRLTASWLRERIGDAVDFEAVEAVAPRFAEIPRAKFEESIHLITPDGRIRKGAAAVFEALHLGQRHRALRFCHVRSPVFARTSEAVYSFVARNRAKFSRVIRFFAGGGFAHPTFHISGEIFFRLLGLIYLFAFLSIDTQVIGLAGENGIAPAADVMKVVAERKLGYWQIPTLCHWTGAGDAALRGLCWAGAGAALAMLIGLVPTLSAAAAWLLYLSLCSVISPFLNFQWDALLLEAGFLAIFLPPLTAWLRPGRANFSAIARWLLVWLLFRLMFSSGVVKLASRDTAWWDLTALTYHYWTQCLPPWTAWYFDKLPLWAQKTSCLIMFAIELVIPFFVFFARRLRHIAAVAFLLLMTVILASGNYGFFDLLTCVLCVPLIDDRAWRGLRDRLLRRRVTPAPHPIRAESTATRYHRRILVVPLLLIIGAISLVSFGRIIAAAQNICGINAPWQPRPPEWIASIHNNSGQFRSVNGYGLFAVMTKDRKEITLEGTTDGITWLPYEFKWKPGDPTRRPRFTTPHMPRLDWQMWFAALGEYRGNPWLIATTVRLLQNEPTVLALLEKNPFPEKPPRAIRATIQPYRFTTAAERDATGHWWKRTDPPLEYFPPILLQPDGRPAFAASAP